MTHFYRKKPVVIEAAMLKPDNSRKVSNWINENGGGCKVVSVHEQPPILLIDTLEGTMRAQVGDFVIKGVKGEFYPCKPDIFAATYERADDPQA